MKHQAANIRNVLLVGHRGSGKTCVLESLAAIAKKGKKGWVEDKNTISDFTVEEKARLSSCNLAVASLEYKDHIINLLDAPGNDDFVFEIIGALNVVKGAIVVIDATKGVEVGTTKHFNMLKRKGIPTFILISKMDKEMIKFDEVLEEVRAKLGPTAIPFLYPFAHKGEFDSFIDIVSLTAKRFEGGKLHEEPLPEDKRGLVEEFHNALTEQVALSDEALLEKFFGGEELTPEEIEGGLRKVIISGEVTPILVGSAKSDLGMTTLLEMMLAYLPAANELEPYKVKKDGKEAVRKVAASEPFSGFVFRTYFDQYRGTTSVIKVVSGTIKVGDDVYVPNINETIRVSQLFYLMGKDQIPTAEAEAGDIIAINKMDDIITGYTLCDKNNVVTFLTPKYPTAVYYRAVSVKNPKDEEKLFASLNKMQVEDPTLDVYRNAETKQLLLGALSDSHIAYVLEKVQNSYNIAVELDAPKINYRETIRSTATAPGRYVKQSGGSGFYGVVEMRFEPNHENLENTFGEEVFGGAVPKNYFPAVEKGFFEATQSGLLAGFPVVGMKAILTDGKYHSVDSNELAFKMAAILAFKEAYMKCNPTILEPIMKITINVHNEFTGNIMNDLNQRRARIMSMDEKGNDIQEIIAMVPEVEILDYAIKMRLLSQGSGFFNREFDSYQQVPTSMIDTIIKQYAEEDK
ncbi:MAG: elongation factor G [Bacilli bacterium]